MPSSEKPPSLQEKALRLGLLLLVFFWADAAFSGPLGKPGTVEPVTLLLPTHENPQLRFQYADGRIATLTNVADSPGFWDRVEQHKAEETVRRPLFVSDEKTPEFLQAEQLEQFTRNQALFRLKDILPKFLKEDGRPRPLTESEMHDRATATDHELIRAHFERIKALREEDRPTEASREKVPSGYSHPALEIRTHHGRFGAVPPDVRAAIFHTPHHSALFIVSSSPDLDEPGGNRGSVKVIALPFSAVKEESLTLKVLSRPTRSVASWSFGVVSLPEHFQFDSVDFRPLSDKTLAIHTVDLEAGVAISGALTNHMGYDYTDGNPEHRFRIAETLFLPTEINARRPFQEQATLSLENWDSSEPVYVLTPTLGNERPFSPLRVSANAGFSDVTDKSKSAVLPREKNRLARTHIVESAPQIQAFFDTEKSHPEPTHVADSFINWMKERASVQAERRGNAISSSFTFLVPDYLDEEARDISNRVVRDILVRAVESIPPHQADNALFLHFQVSKTHPKLASVTRHLFTRVTTLESQGIDHLIFSVDMRGMTGLSDYPSDIHFFFHELDKLRAWLHQNGSLIRLTPIFIGGKEMKMELKNAWEDSKFVRQILGDWPEGSHPFEETERALNAATKIDLLQRILKTYGHDLPIRFLADTVRAIQTTAAQDKSILEDVDQFSKHLNWALRRTVLKKGEEAENVERLAKAYLRVASNRNEAQPFHPSVLAAARSVRRLIDDASPTHIPGALRQRADILAGIESELRIWTRDYPKTGRGQVFVFQGPPGTGKTQMANLIHRVLPADRTALRTVNFGSPEANPKLKSAVPTKPYLGTTGEDFPTSSNNTYLNSSTLRDEIKRKIKELREDAAEVKMLFLDEWNLEPSIMKEFMASTGEGDKKGGREFDLDGILVIIAMNVDEGDETRMLDRLQINDADTASLSRNVFISSLLKSSKSQYGSLDEKAIHAFASRIQRGLFYFRNRKATSGSEQKEEVLTALRPFEIEHGIHRILLPEDTLQAIRARVNDSSGNFRGAGKVLPGIMELALDQFDTLHPEGPSGKVLTLRPPQDRFALQFTLEDVLHTQTGIRQYAGDVYQELVTDLNVALTNELAAAEQRMASLSGTEARNTAGAILSRYQTFLEAFVSASRRKLFDEGGRPSYHALGIRNDKALQGIGFFPDIDQIPGERRREASDLAKYLNERARHAFGQAFQQQWKKDQETPANANGWTDNRDKMVHDKLLELASDFMEGMRELVETTTNGTSLDRPGLRKTLPFLQSAYQEHLAHRDRDASKRTLEKRKQWATDWWARYRELQTKKERGELSDFEARTADNKFLRDLYRSHEKLKTEKHEMGDTAYDELNSFVENIQDVPDETGKYYAQRFIEQLEKQIDQPTAAGADARDPHATYLDMIGAAYALDGLLREAVYHEVEKKSESRQDWERGMEDRAEFARHSVNAFFTTLRQWIAAKAPAHDETKIPDSTLASATLGYLGALAQYNRSNTAQVKPFWLSGGTGIDAFSDELSHALASPAEAAREVSPAHIEALLPHAQNDADTLERARRAFAQARPVDNSAQEIQDCVMNLAAMSQGARARLPKGVRHQSLENLTSPPVVQPSSPAKPPPTTRPRED